MYSALPCCSLSMAMFWWLHIIQFEFNSKSASPSLCHNIQTNKVNSAGLLGVITPNTKLLHPTIAIDTNKIFSSSEILEDRSFEFFNVKNNRSAHTSPRVGRIHFSGRPRRSGGGVRRRGRSGRRCRRGASSCAGRIRA